MQTWKTALCLATLLTAAACAKPPASAASEVQRQTVTDAESYCKTSAAVSHDAILARLEGEKPADTEARLRQKYTTAAQNEESRRLTLSAISIAISKAQRTNVPADSKTSVSAETKNRIADRIGEEEYRFCMNTLNANNQ